MTKMEEIRISRMMQLGCVACAYLEIPYIAQECHHIVVGNRRLGHWFTLPFCRGHHQGDWTTDQRHVIEPKYLVSIADGSKAFTAVYPDEQELWNRVQERLGLTWPASKIVPRRVVA